jgi:NAD+ diphosphatase
MATPTRRREFTPGIMADENAIGPAWWFAFQGNKILVLAEGSLAAIPFVEEFSTFGLPVQSRHYLGLLEGRPCYAAEVPEGASPPNGMCFEGLRQIYGRVDEDLFWVAARAVQIVEWHRTHRFCGRCGIPLAAEEKERAKKCPDCGLLYFPRLAPAIIVLVEWGDKLLLARSRHFAPGMYSVIAGFVEPGESLEETVVREVREEVGISIRGIHYFASQPWPFPHSLMIGFTASYAGGEITIDDAEIEAAGWFTVDDLPCLPGEISIARKLINWFVAKHQ